MASRPAQLPGEATVPRHTPQSQSASVEQIFLAQLAPNELLVWQAWLTGHE